jgi:two-component system, chemotaxis family, sensor kinase CheA
MDVRRFLDLYVSEAQEHVRLLHRSLLRVESDTDGVALGEAFRAAHTLKSLSAAMGFDDVARLAHELEDRLDGVRPRSGPAEGAVVDDLLAGADAIDRAIEAALAGVVPSSSLATGPVPAAPAPHATSHGAGPAIPPGVAAVAWVRIRRDAPMKAVRALLIMQALEDQPGILGAEPSAFDESFSGEFSVHCGDGADMAAVEACILGAGDVDSVTVITAEPADSASPPAGGMSGTALHGTHLRIPAERLDDLADGIGELSVLFGGLTAAGGAAVAGPGPADRMAVVLGQLQRDVLELRMVPVREAFDRLPRVVRDAARRLGKEVDLVVSGEDVELDRSILEEIVEPLVHLLRNAVDHGIEAPAERVEGGKSPRGRIDVQAERERASVLITVSDDGGGMDAARVVEHARKSGILAEDAEIDLTSEEVFRLVSQAGFSTSADVTDVSGRGVGMDVVVNRIRALGGAIDMQTVHGAGTTFSMKLPVTLALVQALRVRLGGEDYAVPLTHVAEVVDIAEVARDRRGRETVRVRGREVTLVRLRPMLGIAAGGREHTAVVTEAGGRRAALAVDALVGREQILVKGFDAVTGMLPYFSGATILADGRPILVLDPLSVF